MPWKTPPKPKPRTAGSSRANSPVRRMQSKDERDFGYVKPATGGSTASGNRAYGGMPLSSGSGDGQQFAQNYSADQAVNRDFNAMYAALLGAGSPTSPGGGSNGGGGSRYGGGGGAAAQKAQYDALIAKLGAAGTADRDAAKAAYGRYDQYAAGLSNPWANIGPAQQAQVDPSVLANLITSQGGGDAGLRAQAQFLQAQNGATAGASDRLAQQMAANQTAWNQSARGQGQLAAAGADTDLAAQLMQLQTMLEMKKAGLA